MGETRIRILHISDLHVRKDDAGPNGWRRRRVLGDAWSRNLDDLIQDEPLDLICFTGDLAHGGHREEYARFQEFIEAVLERTHVPRERLFVVPGNHDVERGKEEEVWQALRGLQHNESHALSQWMAGGPGLRGIPDEYRDRILERQRAYRDWLAKDLQRPELLPNPATGHPRLGYRTELSGWPFPVHIIGFDSAWLAGDDSDQGKLQLTDEQAGRLTDSVTGFRLALVHHPLTDLSDGVACRRLLGDRVDLLLRGHLHETELSLWSDPDRDLREIAAGCLYESDRYPNACQRVDVTLDVTGKPLRYDLRFRAWSSQGFWHDDNSVYRNVKGGRYTWTASPPALASARPPTGNSVSANPRRFSHPELIELHQATIHAGLSYQSLRAGIDPLFVAGLPDTNKAADQLLVDLNEMNRAEVEPSMDPPLATWLRNAVALSGLRKERAVFQRAIDVLVPTASGGRTPRP